MILEGLVLGLLVLVPAVFYLGATEQFEFPKTELLATGALVMLAMLLARELARPRGPGMRARIVAGLRRDPLGAAVLLFLVSSVASTVISIRPDMSVFGAAQYYAAGLKTAFGTAALYFASRYLATDARWIGRVACAAAIALAVATVYAFLQYAHLDPIAWNPSATFGGMARWPGTLAHANHLGTYIAMTVPLVLWLARRTTSLPVRVSCAALILLSLAILAATLSRGAWVAFAAGSFVYVLLAWRAARGETAGRWVPARIVAAVLLALAAASAPLLTPLRPALLSRLRQITDVREPSMHMRVLNWRAGIRMAADHPVLGVGTDAYLAAFPRYRTPEFWGLEWNVAAPKAHNEPIGIAATQGGLGLIAALLVVLLAGRAVWRAASHSSQELREGAAAAGGALAAFAVSDLASFTVVSTGCLAAALAGWAAGVTSAEGADLAGEPAKVPGPLAWAAGAAVAVALWIPLVLLPWLADTAAAKANWTEMSSPVRAEAFARASSIAPWDARYASELGRSLLARAFTVTADSSARWEILDRARSAFERATRIGRMDGENRALLARVLASQAALRPSAVGMDRIHSEFARAIALEPANANVMELATQGYLELGRRAEARDAALRCVALFPDFALPMADIGVLALQDGRAADAADTLRLALGRNWHGQGGAQAAAQRNYAVAIRELGDEAAVKGR
jgi:O-antigen ligase